MTKMVDGRQQDLTNVSHADILAAESEQVCMCVCVCEGRGEGRVYVCVKVGQILNCFLVACCCEHVILFARCHVRV